MINFAFCYEKEFELASMKHELERRFNQKGINIAVKCYKNAAELERCLSCNCPDVLFYDMEAENGLMRNAAIEAKAYNKELISIVANDCQSISKYDNSMLEPLYILPDKSRKQLWSYAVMAYEYLLDDENSFSYYVRPDYVHIPVKDIMYFASEGRQTHIAYEGCRDTFYQKLDNVEKYMSRKNAQFIRIHKSYLVNSSYIASYNRNFVLLTTGERLRISKYEYYKFINDLFRNSLKKRSVVYAEL